MIEKIDMKYYSYNTWRTHPSEDAYVRTLSEEEIVKEYWNYWQERMIAKFGKEHFEANYSEKDCIDDWVVVNWAWEELK
jgi:hypothetical protein